MFINAYSKFLPLVFDILQDPHKESGFELIFLVESARYHAVNLERLVIEDVRAPNNFDPGIRFHENIFPDQGGDKDKAWRNLAAPIEFEGFINSVNRFFYRANKGISQGLGTRNAKIPFGQLTMRVPLEGRSLQERKILRDTKFKEILKTARDDWGYEIKAMRDYIEHGWAFGGRSTGVMVEDQLILMIPDRVINEHNRKKIPKGKLNCNEQRTALDFSREHMRKLDDLFDSLLRSISYST